MSASDQKSVPNAMANLPLFRREALEARQSQWLGSIRIGRPLSFSVVTGASLAMATALVAFACWGELPRKVTLHGVLLPAGGLINLTAPQAGVIAELLVNEGAEVEAGQPLVRIKTERISKGGDVAILTTQALAARRSSLDAEKRLIEQTLRQRQDGIAQRLQSLQVEERQALTELDTHRLREQLALRSVERQQQLAREGFVAQSQVQQKQEELMDLQLRLRNAERTHQGLQRDLQTVRTERQLLEMQHQTQLTQLDRSIAALQQEAAEIDSRTSVALSAPQAGRITALTLGAGQSVQTGQTLISLVPAPKAAAELQAQLFAPSRTAGFLRRGQTVWLRYEAFPYQKFGMAQGEVINISRSPIASQDLPAGQAQALISAAQTNEPMYRVTVRLPQQSVRTYGTSTPLEPGMHLDADVRQESRKVWEWLLEPILATSQKQKF